MIATNCPCQAPENRERMATLLRTARTKADLIELVGMLDRRNLQLQRVRDQLGVELAQARLNTGRSPLHDPRETQ